MVFLFRESAFNYGFDFARAFLSKRTLENFAAL
jgi:hypothetical protein